MSHETSGGGNSGTTELLPRFDRNGESIRFLALEPMAYSDPPLASATYADLRGFLAQQTGIDALGLLETWLDNVDEDVAPIRRSHVAAIVKALTGVER